MSAFFIYLLKASGWIAVWWSIYHFFLRKEKFYVFNRAYLMTGLAASFLISLVKIHYPVKIFMAQTSIVTVAGNVQAQVHHINIYTVLFFIYISCIAFLIIRQLFLLLKIKALIRSAGYTVVDNYRLVDSPDAKITFSFFNYIFLNSHKITDIERQLILAHERSHIFQRHWIDLAVAESACILLWFNPFSWFYLRSVKENHEYFADESVIGSGYSPVFYRAALINQSFNTSVFPFVNSFSHYKFKRIAMMKKETSNPLKKLAVMLLIPAACFFLWAFSEPEYRVTTVESTVSQKDTVKVRGDSTVLHVIVDEEKTTIIPIKKQPVLKALKGKVIDITSKDSTISKNQKQFKFYSTTGTYTTCDSPPLCIVDGKEVSSIEEIDPHQIESISVLKDTSAVEIYGGKGKNGVIMIVTKGNESTVPTLQISGTVTNAKDGKPLPGVSIVVERTTKGTITNMDGKYSLNVPANAVLQFSFINMLTKKVFVNYNNEVINVSLDANMEANDTIQANTAVLKNQQSGEITYPLYIVDGKEFSSLATNAPDPNQIESISILKKESADRLYGDKGKNGVVIITTKRK